MSTLVFVLFLQFWLIAATKANIRRLSDVTCPPSYEWTFNSLGQSPCEVAAYAMSPCYAGELLYVNALPSDVPYYTGPTLEEANICRCTSVLYSLFSACAACQGKDSGSWSAWKAQCLFPYISALPAGIPEGTAIPAWAFSFYAENDVFNVTAVKLLADSGQPDVTPDSDILQQRPPTRSTLMSSTSSMPKTYKSNSRVVDSATSIPTSNTFSASPDVRERALTTAAWVVIGIVILLVIGLAIAIMIRLRRYYRHTRAYRDLQKEDGVTATSPLQIGRGSRPVLRNGYSPVESVLDPELQYVPYNAQAQNLNGQ